MRQMKKEANDSAKVEARKSIVSALLPQVVCFHTAPWSTKQSSGKTDAFILIIQ